MINMGTVSYRYRFSPATIQELAPSSPASIPFFNPFRHRLQGIFPRGSVNQERIELVETSGGWPATRIGHIRPFVTAPDN
jgi:hypothetical protein